MKALVKLSSSLGYALRSQSIATEHEFLVTQVPMLVREHRRLGRTGSGDIPNRSVLGSATLEYQVFQDVTLREVSA